MNPNENGWQKLTAAARRWRDERDAEAPYGFAVRVAALAMSEDPVFARSLFERFSWRALGLAALLALVSLAADYSALAQSASDDGGFFDETTVTSVFEIS
ncbi:MAG TPA: hypothetical protein VG710_18510 [Opitutus sp.]|nr:hypothetical protein [Opitutus sp.]